MGIVKTFSDADEKYAANLATDYYLDFLAGDDRLVATAGTIKAYMGAGNDFVQVTGGLVTLYGEQGLDRFDIYAAGSVIDGGSDNDIFNLRGGSNASLSGGTGADRFNFLANTLNASADGGDGDDLFVGYSRSVSGSLFGGAGNDRFLDFGNHGGRSVILSGGTGNDVYRLDGLSPAQVKELGGEGTDTVQITGGASYTLSANVENLVALDRPSSIEPAELTGNALANRIRGSSGNEILNGLAGNDYLYGGDGEDVIYGGDGNDRIYGGAGLDYIVTGGGRDIVYFSSTADAPAATPMGADFIQDWTALDRIDVSAIDANELLPGNQAFEITSILFGAPSGPQPAGSAVLCGFGGELYVLLYTNADGEPDMIISLFSQMGEAALTRDSLIL